MFAAPDEHGSFRFTLAVELGGGRAAAACRRHRRVMAARGREFRTSTSAELSLLIANVGQVDTGSVVLDPYSGSGALLVASAGCGAGLCIGSDVCHAERGAAIAATAVTQAARKELLAAVFETAVADVADERWRGGEWVDAVLTDPPYGLRERCQHGLSGGGDGRGSQCYIDDADGVELHARAAASLAPVLNLAAQALRRGRRLVYLFPLYPSQEGMGLWPWRDGGGDTAVPARPACCDDLPRLADEALALLPITPGLRLIAATVHLCRSKAMARAVVALEKE